MDAGQKKRLKQAGKQLVERQSRELQERLKEANPAPTGTAEWARNYEVSAARDRPLRTEQPDIIAAAVATAEFVLQPVDPAPLGVPTWYIECPKCHDLLHSVPRTTVLCTCGAVELNVEMHRVVGAYPG